MVVFDKSVVFAISRFCCKIKKFGFHDFEGFEVFYVPDTKSTWSVQRHCYLGQSGGVQNH